MPPGNDHSTLALATIHWEGILTVPASQPTLTLAVTTANQVSCCSAGDRCSLRFKPDVKHALSASDYPVVAGSPAPASRLGSITRELGRYLVPLGPGQCAVRGCAHGNGGDSGLRRMQKDLSRLEIEIIVWCRRLSRRRPQSAGPQRH